jgi:hypothetical protein
LASRSGVTSAAITGAASASMLLANSAVRVEPMRRAMMSSHCEFPPLRCGGGLATGYTNPVSKSAACRVG